MSVEILQFFDYGHLPPNLQNISKEFFTLAYMIAGTIQDNAERSTALRKLLESKDCAVRAAIWSMKEYRCSCGVDLKAPGVIPVCCDHDATPMSVGDVLLSGDGG